MGISAVILAAGRGSRLHPLTDTQPKAMTELNGRGLIDYQVETLNAAGIDDVTVITGYRGDMFRAPATRYVENPAWDSTNMVESLFCAEAHFGDDLIVCYGDIVFETEVIQSLLACPAATGVVIDKAWRTYWESRLDNPLEDAETLKLSSSGAILEIGQKPKSYEDIDGQYIGLMRFQNQSINDLRAARARILADGISTRPDADPKKAYMTDLLTTMIDMGASVTAVPINRGWYEIDTYRDYEVARDNIVLDEHGGIVRCP